MDCKEKMALSMIKKIRDANKGYSQSHLDLIREIISPHEITPLVDDTAGISALISGTISAIHLIANVSGHIMINDVEKLCNVSFYYVAHGNSSDQAYVRQRIKYVINASSRYVAYHNTALYACAEISDLDGTNVEHLSTCEVYESQEQNCLRYFWNSDCSTTVKWWEYYVHDPDIERIITSATIEVSNIHPFVFPIQYAPGTGTNRHLSMVVKPQYSGYDVINAIDVYYTSPTEGTYSTSDPNYLQTIESYDFSIAEKLISADALSAAFAAYDANIMSIISQAITGLYTPAGSKAANEIVAALLIADNLGKVYNLSSDLTIAAADASNFVENAANFYPAGTNIVVVNIGTTANPSYKFDALAGAYPVANGVSY